MGWFLYTIQALRYKKSVNIQRVGPNKIWNSLCEKLKQRPSTVSYKTYPILLKGYVCKCDIKLSAIKYQPYDLFRISKSPLKAKPASVQIESSDIFLDIGPHFQATIDILDIFPTRQVLFFGSNIPSHAIKW